MNESLAAGLNPLSKRGLEPAGKLPITRTIPKHVELDNVALTVHRLTIDNCQTLMSYFCQFDLMSQIGIRTFAEPIDVLLQQCQPSRVHHATSAPRQFRQSLRWQPLS